MKRLGNLFRAPDGKSYAFVFVLVCSLFLLWGFAHALLDVLNKHFQNSLVVTKAQSGCVQTAVYGGYFLMALPAGMIARRFGYKGGILFGLFLFAVGAFWFVPATKADKWNGVSGWVANKFNMEVVASPEAKAKLLDVRMGLERAAKNVERPLDAKKLAEFDPAAAEAKAAVNLAAAKVALEEAAKLLPASKRLPEAREALTKLSPALPEKEFIKQFEGAKQALVAIDQATQWTAFSAFLIGLFVIALGLTCLETIANPYTTVLGPPETGASRINLAQTNNAVGWILGPFVGGLMIFSSTGEVNLSNAQLATPYFGLGLVVTLVFIMFACSKIPDVHTPEHAQADKQHQDRKSGERSLWSQPHFVLAVVAQFLYVAAQTGINSFFINYVVEVNKWPEQKAALLLSLGGMVLFMIGRLSGSFLMNMMKPHLALALYGLCNVICMALVVSGLGVVSAGALIASYFFMSVMFPTIFALGIRGLGENTKKGSAFIVMAIVGGAISPVLMGLIADKSGMQLGFVIPLVCFVGVMAYGFTWRKLFARDMGSDVVTVTPAH